MLQQLLELHPLQVSLLTLIITFFIKWLISSPKSTPPSPPKLPIIGNFHQLGTYPHRSLFKLSQRYGPLMLLHFGSRPVLIVSSAEIAREITKTHDVVFSSKPNLTIVRRLLYNNKDVAGAPYGEYWRQMKSVCVLHLLSTKRVMSYRKVREEEVEILIKDIKKLSDLSKPVNLNEMLSSVTNHVIARVVCGKKFGEDDEDGKKFKDLIGELMRLLGDYTVVDYIPWLSWVNKVNGHGARVDKTAKNLDVFLDKIVQEHEDRLKRNEKSDEKDGAEEGPKDLVDVLLQLQKENKDSNFSLGRENIKAILSDMFTGGTDSSYTVVEWAMTELIRHPRVMKKLQDEVRSVTFQEYITESDLYKMNYMKLVIKETFRLHPPGPLLSPRETTEDVRVQGYDIAAGTMVLTNAWALGRDPKSWNKPDEFWPERFINSSIEYRGQDFELIPFGTGRRMCPGITFAMSINELVLANIVKIFDWSLPGGTKGEDLDSTEIMGAAVHRKEPLIAIATPSSF